jgi:alkylation response protein AidB-like acyl-CoA dehydrogenase
MGIPFPEEYGGGGGDSLAYAIAVEELTRVDSSVAITLCAHTSLGTQPIYLFGTEEQKQEWLPRADRGRDLGAFGLTEPEAGSDAGNVRTRAGWTTASGRSTAPSSSSPTRAPTSRRRLHHRRAPARTRSPT